MYGYTYRTTNRVNGHVYVGQRRSGFDPEYLGSGTLIQRAVAKHGTESFLVEPLEFADSKKELDLSEQRQIIIHRTLYGRANVYNITPGGEGCGKGAEHPNFGKKMNAEQLARMSETHKGPRNWLFGKGHLVTGSNNPHFGKHNSEVTKSLMSQKRKEFLAHGGVVWNKGKKCAPWTPEFREMMMAARKKGKGLKGLKRSDETKKKLSEIALLQYANGRTGSFTGRKHSQASKDKMAGSKRLLWATKVHPMLGKHHSSWTKKIISEQHKAAFAAGLPNPMTGRKHSESTRKKISQSVRAALLRAKGEVTL